ncbi:MAG TPA: arylesterase [Opitutaceae bacterium]|nr:arylesterase [Opitutaceae bacterium]
MKLLLAIALAVLPLAQAAGPAAAPRPHTIVFFGDSLTAGYGLDDPEAEAYPALVQQKIEAAHLDWRVINAGLSGDTTAGGLHRVDWILRQPVGIFFLALGANDGLRGIDPDVTRRNLEEIVARVRSKAPNATIIIAGMRMPPSMGEDYTQRFQEVFPAVAAAAHTRLLPFLLEGVAGRPDLNQADAIHPNENGAKRVADTVWQMLRPLL